MKKNLIIITGSSGFLGRHVLNQLQIKNYKIKKIRSKKYDLKKIENCIKVLEKNSILIHLAADAGGIGYNQKNPYKLFYNNLVINTNIIEAARIKKVKKVILIGSICSYPSVTKTPFNEIDIWKGYPEKTNAPYGLAKKMMLVQSEICEKEHKIRFTNLLLSNLYGPNDNFHSENSHVIPAIIKKVHKAIIEENNTVTLWGSGKPTRDFTFVNDAARAIVKSITINTTAKPINIGSGKSITIKKLALIIKKKMNYRGKFLWENKMPDGQKKRLLSTSRARKVLNYKSTTSISDGLDETIEWYLNNY